MLFSREKKPKVETRKFWCVCKSEEKYLGFQENLMIDSYPVFEDDKEGKIFCNNLEKTWN